MPVVLDISSDEESPLVELPKGFDYEWIKEFLGVDDKEVEDKEQDDSDEVVVVGEVNPQDKSKSLKQMVKDADDDDCVLLDCDPDNPVTSVTEEANGSDDLQIVGEKGQIACRDYPHPRHLCAKFPFTSTSHERHCEQCHCFVCDSLAPCIKWGTGISSTDHCHATDKSEIWKTQRRNLKMGKPSTLAASKSSVTSPFMTPPLVDQVSPLVIRLAPNSISQNQVSNPATTHGGSLLNSQQNQASGPTTIHACSSLPFSQNQVSQPNAFRACSAGTNFTVPGIIRHGTSQESGFRSARRRHMPRQLLGVRNKVIHRDRAHNTTSNLGPQFDPSNVIFKSAGAVESAQATNHSAVSSGNGNCANVAPRYDRHHTPRGLSNDRNCNRLDYVWPSMNLPSYTCPISTQPNLDHVSESTVCSEVQVHSQPLPHLSDNQSVQHGIQGHDAHPTRFGCPSVNEYVSQRTIASLPAYQDGIQSGNISAHGNHSQSAIIQTSHQGSQSAINEDISACDFSWVENTSQINQPSAGNSHLETTGSATRLLPVEESNTLFAGSNSLSSIDLLFENWLLQSQSPPLGADGLVPSELNVVSPGPTAIDESMLLFDFENSWNDLANV